VLAIVLTTTFFSIMRLVSPQTSLRRKDKAFAEKLLAQNSTLETERVHRWLTQWGINDTFFFFLFLSVELASPRTRCFGLTLSEILDNGKKVTKQIRIKALKLAFNYGDHQGDVPAIIDRCIARLETAGMIGCDIWRFALKFMAILVCLSRFGSWRSFQSPWKRKWNGETEN